jgi:superfamily II helicase
MAACLFSNPCVHWDDILEWSCKLKGKSLQKTLCKLCLAAAVYHIWRLRNDLCYGNTPLTEEALVDRIKGEVRTRVMSRKKLKNSSGRLSKQWRL